ncbi:hypothetical protein PoB_000276200 [Plakobranchus ocellatus]|uniref:Uncharacterized protein n=1 Tax=Plakobranchus ocellatus TaxID=259542 RepID=A0AAV3Y1D5_9GAST|nr:hypothetical protein PoB_000276200 [Plakobranchus ocellatus]
MVCIDDSFDNDNIDIMMAVMHSNENHYYSNGIKEDDAFSNNDDFHGDDDDDDDDDDNDDNIDIDVDIYSILE